MLFRGQRNTAIHRCQDEGAGVVQHREPGAGNRAGRATVRDVAAETGLSVATVSRVINGQANVSEEAGRLVREAVIRLGPRAPQPRRPSARSTGAVFVRCPYILSDYFGLIVSSVAETLTLHGRRMVLDAGEGSARSKVLREIADWAGVAGAIMILPPEPSADLEALRARRFPFVVIDPMNNLPGDVASVSAAHASGARNLTRHLVGLGHRRLGFVCGPAGWIAGQERLSGYYSALAEARVLADPELIRFGEADTGTGRTAGGELLDLPQPPTAIVCFNDKIAVGVLQAAAARGIRVPQDLSVTGFDDIDVSRATTPQLTTVRQPLQEMGRMAVTTLVRLLERQRLDALHIELATEVVIRGSTAHPAAEPVASGSSARSGVPR
jgi:LacI family transcriptional regulator